MSISVATDPSSLISMLDDENAVVREKAAYALGRFSPESEAIFAALGKCLFDPDDEVSTAAAVSLFGCGARSKRVLPDLLNALHHKNSNVKCLVMATLGFIGPDANDALPILVEESRSPDPRMRRWSIEAMKSIAPPDSAHSSLPFE